jgi:hypothetical protein
VLALVLVFAVSSVALAVGSPVAGAIAGVSSEDPNASAELKVISTATAQDVIARALAYLRTQYSSVQLVMAADLDVVSAQFPVTVSLNVAGVKVGDQIGVAHLKADNTIEYVAGNVPTDGVVSFTLSSFSPIAIFRVGATSSAAAGAMYKTGDSTSTVAMVLLIAAGIVVLAVCGKALKRAK